jgi:hypothetical protein
MKSYRSLKVFFLGVLLLSSSTFAMSDNGVGSHGKVHQQQQQQQQQARCDDYARAEIYRARKTLDKCGVEYDKKDFKKLIKSVNSLSSFFAPAWYDLSAHHALKHLEKIYERNYLPNTADQACYDQEVKDLQAIKDGVDDSLKRCRWQLY